MLRQTPNRRHRWLAPANSDLESWYESWPGYHPVEVHTQAGPTHVSLHNQAVEALGCATFYANIRRKFGDGTFRVISALWGGCRSGEWGKWPQRRPVNSMVQGRKVVYLRSHFFAQQCPSVLSP